MNKKVRIDKMQSDYDELKKQYDFFNQKLEMVVNYLKQLTGPLNLDVISYNYTIKTCLETYEETLKILNEELQRIKKIINELKGDTQEQLIMETEFKNI